MAGDGIGPHLDRLLVDAVVRAGLRRLLEDADGLEVVPADFSLGMLRQGLKQSPQLDFTAADATRLPFADASFDVVTMSFGFRNVVEPEVALREFLRVATPGGRLLICEFSQPVNRAFRTIYSEYLMAAFPPVARRLSSLASLTRCASPPDSVVADCPSRT